MECVDTRGQRPCSLWVTARLVNIYLRSDAYFLLFFASLLLILMLFDVLMSNVMFIKGAITYKTYLYNVYICTYKHISIHKHYKQTYINILTYIGIICSIIT